MRPQALSSLQHQALGLFLHSSGCRCWSWVYLGSVFFDNTQKLWTRGENSHCKFTLQMGSLECAMGRSAWLPTVCARSWEAGSDRVQVSPPLPLVLTGPSASARTLQCCWAQWAKKRECAARGDKGMQFTLSWAEIPACIMAFLSFTLSSC